MTTSLYATPSWCDAPAIAHAHGFCIVEDFFDPAELTRWEGAALALSETDRLKDFLTLPPFRALLLDGRVLDLARALIGPELVYYGETAFSLGHPPFRAWHCDARGQPHDLNAPYETSGGEVYPGWRFGVYFRDYSAASGGLKVGPGSHLRPGHDLLTRERTATQYKFAGGDVTVPTPPFPIYNVPSRPGDLVIFNLRTFHSAGALLMKENPQAQLMPDVEAHLLARSTALFEETPPAARNALFFDFGGPSLALDLYIKWRAHSIRRDPKLHPPAWQAAIKDSDLGIYAYDQPTPQSTAKERGIILRFDRIIAQLLYKKDILGTLAPSDRARLDLLVKINTEFSPYHALAEAG